MTIMNEGLLLYEQNWNCYTLIYHVKKNEYCIYIRKQISEQPSKTRLIPLPGVSFINQDVT